MIVISCEQRESDWFLRRNGIPSASQFDKIVTTKGEPSKSAHKYMLQLAGETILGHKEETYQSAAMARGCDLENEAILLYEMISGEAVSRAGLVYKDDRKDRCCSPDGLIGEHKGLEVKCPLIATHTEYLLAGKLPTDYFQQVHGSMYICGFEEWDFMSYYPGMPPLIITVKRDMEFCAKLGKALDEFNTELKETVARLRAMI